jgi:hypothetical protein
LEGYFGAAQNGNYPTFASQQVTVDAQQPVPEISLSLVRSGSISGRVRDAEGKLMVNADVSAGVPVPGDGTVVISTSKTTDDRGEYRLFGLPPGEYLVGVGVQGVLSKVDTWSGTFLQRYKRITPGQGIAPANGQTFFPNTPSVSEATLIVLKEGEEIGGIDIMTRPVLPSDAPLQRAPVFRR